MKALLIALLVTAATAVLRAQQDRAEPGVRHQVRSTEVAWVLYEPKTRTLQLRRREGPVLEYYNVPAEVYRQLMSNEFMGGFVKANLEKKYPSKIARLDTRRG